MKYGVENLADGSSLYRAKLWRSTDPEPTDWDFKRSELQDDVATGSALLLAHPSDVTFGDILVNPL